VQCRAKDLLTLPYLQPKTSNTFGFMPEVAPGTLIRTTPYGVSSSEGFIAAGDIVLLSSITGGAFGMVRAGSTAGGTIGIQSTSIVGVAAHCMLSDQGSTAANYNTLTSAFLLVYDDPLVQYVVSDQASSASGFLLTSQVGQTVSVLSSGGLGSTGPFQSGSLNGRSNQVISAGTTGVAAPFKLLGLHPIDAATSSGIGRKWIVAPNAWMLAPGQIDVTT
jgi:hypothetical protein